MLTMEARKAAYQRRYYAENREAILERSRRYRAKNREAILEQGHRYRGERREAKAAYQRGYYAENREAIAEKKRRRYVQDVEAWGRKEILARQLRRERTLRERATMDGFEWSKAEDAYLLKNWRLPVPALASTLGRTYSAVSTRRTRLRKRGLVPA